MALPGYLVTNALASATITPSSEDSTYTKASLFDSKLTKPFRWTTKTGCSLLFSFGSAQSFNFVGMFGHTFTSGATVTLKAGTTSACSNWSQAITYSATDMVYKFAAQNYQYWKLEVEDSGHASYPGICEMFLGSMVSISRMYQYGMVATQEYTNDIHETEFGSLTVYERFSRRSGQYQWSPVTYAMGSEIGTLIQAVKGSLTPFVWMPDDSQQVAIFGRINSNYSLTANPAPFFTTGFIFREESRGKVIT